MLEVTDTEKLGKLIRVARKAQGLTQEQLAGVCGVGVRFIRELEHGKDSCHIGKAMTVLQMLGLQLHIEGGSV
jgi:y4mF family transcriptional regulator